MSTCISASMVSGVMDVTSSATGDGTPRPAPGKVGIRTFMPVGRRTLGMTSCSNVSYGVGVI